MSSRARIDAPRLRLAPAGSDWESPPMWRRGRWSRGRQAAQGPARMRGRRDPQTTMLALVDLEERVPRNHPLRVVKQFADRALRELSPVFDEMYATSGRPSIPPERLLKASLLISLYSVRSERAFCEELDYDLLFRWFLGMNLIEPSFDHSTFSKNRARLLRHRVSREFFDAVVLQADRLHP